MQNHPKTLDELQPLAIEVLKITDNLRRLLRQQIQERRQQKSQKIGAPIPPFFSSEIIQSFVKWDQKWAEFELEYLTRMKKRRSPEEPDKLLDFACLIGEAINHLLRKQHITQEMVNDCEPSLIFAIPRVAILA